MKKSPFNRFSEIVSAGGSTVWGSPADVGSVVGGEEFDVVLDNNGKDLDASRPVIDWAKSAGAKQFLFISSAGIYKPTDEPPHDVAKADAGHVGVEKYIEETFDSWALDQDYYPGRRKRGKDYKEGVYELPFYYPRQVSYSSILKSYALWIILYCCCEETDFIWQAWDNLR
ncbi:unnamed protein product [Vicia faba]|uniref:NAD-dependent epimerase/dehydratase domain-containing protein n=1 Tax=Vicia faba TaxID=3906 RepID=A0AAV0Z5M9_VICFA|nr:unnamed protein product [Vicia faba]